MLGEQRLVGGDDVAAGLERRLDRRSRAAPSVAADQFDEDVDIGDLRQLDRVVEPLLPRRDRRRGRAVRSRAETAATTSSRPHWRRQLGRLVARARATTDAPTVPSPAIPTRNALPCHAAGRRPLENRADRNSSCGNAATRSAEQRHHVVRAACGADRPRKRLMLRAAWRMRCSFSTSAMRT